MLCCDNIKDWSIQALRKRHPSVPFWRILRGPRKSSGGILQGFGYKTHLYRRQLTLGQMVATVTEVVILLKRMDHVINGNVNGIQIESPRSLRQKETWIAYTKDLAIAIKRFVGKYC